MSDWPGAILAVPLASGSFAVFSAGSSPKNKVWGVERPALETWTAILAFARSIGWLGNPAWWRETLPRLAHYYTLNVDREHSLPNIQIIYFGQIYEFSLPWHNAWVLIGNHRARRDPGRRRDRPRLGDRPDSPRPVAVLLS